MLIDYGAIEGLVDIKGVIHVGAYNGAESRLYGSLPAKFVEADPNFYMTMKILPHHEKYHFAACSYKGTAVLNRMPFGPANSLLKPNLNMRRSDVYVKETIEVPADRIDSIQQGENFLNLDIQGGELDALKGVDFAPIDAILCEVHSVETYKNVPQVEDIDAYVAKFGFVRVLTKFTKYGWGDALYLHNHLEI